MSFTPQQRAQIAQKDSYYLLMPLELGHPHSVAAHTRKLAQLLRGNSPSPCGDAVRHLVKLYDRSAQPDPAIACRKGCSHCCSQEVSVTAPEAFHVAAQLEGRPAAAVAEAAGLAPEERWRDWPRCPLLAGLETPTTLPAVTESEITALAGFVAAAL